MRILIVPSWYPSADNPFDGSFFREQARMLADAGHEVAVLALRTTPVQKWRATQGFDVMEEDGIRVLRGAVPMFPRGTRMVGHSVLDAVARRAFGALGVDTPDVIHAHSALPALLVARELSTLLSRPYVFTEHRPSSVAGPKAGRRYLELKHAVAQSGACATVSAPFARMVGDYYGRADVRVVHLPVPEAFFEQPLRKRDADSPFVFLHVSHLDEAKRVDLLLRAFERVVHAAGAAATRVVIVGGAEGPRREYENLAAELGISESVSFLGPVAREDLPRVVGESDCFVLPSDYEAGGTVISEARACGIPVIATETWGGKGNVEESCGLLTPVGDEDALADAMNAMMEGPPSGIQTRAEIRRRARELYSADAFVNSQTAMYDDAISRFSMQRMIFHAPFPLEKNPTTASRLRPAMMRHAFEDEGFAVEELTGFPQERRIVFSRIRHAARAGKRYEFLYSENSTQPNLLSTTVKKGVAPFLELRIFAWSRRAGISTGEFYRDVYWKFGKLRWYSPYELVKHVSYRFDAWALRHTGVHIFLPSDAMQTISGFAEGSVSALPPGAAIHESPAPDDLSIFYVGGLGDHYGLQAAFRAVSAVEGVRLTVCVREKEWELNRGMYEDLLTDRIRIVHAASNELGRYYDDASLCLLFVEPSEYRKFAAPVKFFEYLGYGKPMVVSDGTHAADLARRLGVGIVLPYDEHALIAELKRLRESPGELEALTERVREVRLSHTWARRARSAANTLMKLRQSASQPESA